MEEPRENEYIIYEEVHCPFCGSTDIDGSSESFNFKAAFWGTLFLSIWGVVFGWLCRKRTNCYCHRCGREFSFYE